LETYKARLNCFKISKVSSRSTITQFTLGNLAYIGMRKDNNTSVRGKVYQIYGLVTLKGLVQQSYE
jgi:hypothetical protein